MEGSIHLQLVPRSRKCGSIYPLPHTPSWHNAYLLKHRDKFTFYGRKHLCQNLRFYPGICLYGLRKSIKETSAMAVKLQTLKLPNKSWNSHQWGQLVQSKLCECDESIFQNKSKFL
jgi:hypothetical protein